MPERPSRTREKLLSCGERLFASKGYEETSIREICELADANVAAVNYHFGSKENLYLEIIRVRTRDMRERQLAALTAAGEVVETEGVKPLLRALVRTFLKRSLSETGNDFITIVFREFSEPGPGYEIIYDELILHMNRALRGYLSRAFPELGRERQLFAIASIMGQILHFVRARRMIEKLGGRPYDEQMIEDICEHIATFSARGMGS